MQCYSQISYNMVVSEISKNCNPRDKPNPRGVASTQQLQLHDNDNQPQELIEVELAKRNMKVSADAWKAFQVYQQYEDWSSETEKTDYTYSPMSTYHSKEVVPGIPVRPNLCRSPLKSLSHLDYTPSKDEYDSHYNSYTSALNNSFAQYSLRHRSVIQESNDTLQRSSIVAEVSSYQRFVQFFLSVWESLSTRINAISSRFGAAVRYSSSAFAAFFVAIWSYTGVLVNRVSSSIAEKWRGIYHGENQGDGRSRWLTDNGGLIWLKRTTTTITSIVTNNYYSTMNVTNAAGVRKYLWLLLVPLILMAGWYHREEIESRLLPQESLLHISQAISIWGRSLPEYVQSILQSSWSAIVNAAVISMQIPTECAFYVWSSLWDGAIFIWDFICMGAYTLQDVFVNVYVILANVIFECFAYIVSGFVFNDTDSVFYPRDYVESIEKNPNEQQLGYNDGSSYISAIENRIKTLESILIAEKARRDVEEEKMAASLKSFRNSLQKYSLQSDMASRRCPCQPRYITSETSSVNVDGYIRDIEKMMEAMGIETTAEIAKLRRDMEMSSSRELSNGGFDAGVVRKIVDAAIKVYDADKTGRADYALQSAGGRVVSIRCTKAYSNTSPSWNWMSTFWTTPGGPEEAIRPGTAPGECWAFQGAVGQLALELSYSIRVTGFTMEHISKHLSPHGTIDSAPQHFSVWGLKHADDLTEQYLFGEYTYLDNDQTVQYYQVQNPIPNTFKFIELKIVSNHGHPDYTCLYRIRVHGTVT